MSLTKDHYFTAPSATKKLGWKPMIVAGKAENEKIACRFR